MMTPQEAASSTFPKATIGGYNMAAVDVFLDKLTEDYTSLYKENAALKAKIKVLVDKMEEYHAMEETMRSTLLTAQKMANTMVAEAEQKSAALVADGEEAARKRIAELNRDVSAEEQRLAAVRAEIDEKIEVEHNRLAAAQRELASFLGSYRRLCEKQLEFIERLPELQILPEGFVIPEKAAEPAPIAAPPPVPAPAPAAKPVVEDTVRLDELAVEGEVDDAVAAAALAEVVEELGGDANSLMKSMQNVIDSFAHEENGEAAAPAEESPVEEIPFEIGFEDAESLFEENAAPKAAEEDPFAADEDPFVNDEEDENATRVINLDDLQFGRNYTKD